MAIRILIAAAALAGCANSLCYAADTVQQLIPAGAVAMVRDANLGSRPVMAHELGPFTQYRVSLKFYSVADNLPFGPLPAEAKLIEEESCELLDGFGALFTTTRGGGAYLPQIPVFQDGQLLPAAEKQWVTTIAGSRIAVRPPHLFDTPSHLGLPAQLGTGIRCGRDARIIAASDRVRCGELEFEVYCPGANRVEINVEKKTGLNALKFDGTNPLPQIETTTTDYAPHGWLSASLSGTDLGYMFDDGTTVETTGL